MQDTLARLHALLERVDPAHPRVVARWIDESRICAQGESGYTVMPVARVVLTARLEDGQLARESFEGITLPVLRQALAAYPIDALMRTDNVTR